MDILEFIDTIILGILNELGYFAPILACFLIVIESIIPILPLSVFITINAYYLGDIFGFIISYIFTIIGCYISYKFCNSKLRSHYYYMLDKKEHKRLNRITKRIVNLKLEELALIIAMPFTPAFMVNIAAGVSGIDRRKYVVSLVIGKIFLIIFWQFIGTSLIDSFNNPLLLIKIVILMVVVYIISKIINKKFRLE